MMNKLHTPVPEGRRGLRQRGVMLLFFCASLAYGPLRAEESLEKRLKASAVITEVLDAAQARGYPQTEMLATMLKRGEITARAAAMTDAVLDCIGTERVTNACARHGLID